MYTVLGGLAAFAASPLDPNVSFWILATALVAAISLTYWFDQIGADAILGIGLFLTLLPPFFAGPLPAAFAALSLLLFLIAKVFHSADNAAEAWVGHTGHAAWHCWTALAFCAAFLASHVAGRALH
jgi:hypothetical protein